MHTRLAKSFVFGAVALAIWAGGRISFDFAPVAPGAWVYESFWQRMLPGPAYALICAWIAAAALIALFPIRVSILPAPSIAIWLILFWFAVAVSVAETPSLHFSLIELSKWSAAILCFGAVVAVCGRVQGPKELLFTIFIAVVIVALAGIWEYLGNSDADPNYRIFSGWMNPNALASILSLGPAVGLALAASSSSRLPVRLLFVLGIGSVFAALWLTGSKGGVVCCVFSLVMMLAALAVHLRSGAMQALPRLFTLAVFSLLFCAAILFACKPKDAKQPSRIVAFQSESAQSFAFRKQLWLDTVQMIEAQPLTGHGAGSFPVAFSKFSKTEGSKLAHQGYLQLAAESGLPALIAFLGFAIAWLTHTLRRHASAHNAAAILSAGTIGAVIGGALNAMFESTFSYPGFCIVWFALMAVGLTLSPDGARSDKLPRRARFAALVPIAAVSFVYPLLAAISEVEMSEGLHALSIGELNRAKTLFQSAAGATPALAAPYSRQAEIELLNHNAAGAIQLQSRAAELMPTSENEIKLAELYEAAGSLGVAQEHFNQACALSPYSPRPLAKLTAFFIRNNMDALAEPTARKLIAMETTQFFTLRALTDFVNTDTVEARLYLAQLAKKNNDRNGQIEMLRGAFKILREYVNVTYRYMKTMHDRAVNNAGISEQQFQQTPFGPQFEKAKQVREQFQSVGNQLIQALNGSGNSREAAEIAVELNQTLNDN